MNPSQIAIAAQRSIEGLPLRAIASELGVHNTTVMRDLRRPEIKAKIERAGETIINRGLQPAVKTLCRLAAMGNVKGQDKDSLKLALDASKHITSMAGLSGTTPSTIINAMIQVNQSPEQSRELDGISAFLSSQWADKAIDMDRKYPVEPTGVDNKYPVGQEARADCSGVTGNAASHTECINLDTEAEVTDQVEENADDSE